MLAQVFVGDRARPHTALFQRARELHGAALAEQPFDLAEDDGHGVGAEFEAAALVKAADRHRQPEAPRRIQVVVFDPFADETLRAGVHQPEVLLDQLISRRHTRCG